MKKRQFENKLRAGEEMTEALRYIRRYDHTSRKMIFMKYLLRKEYGNSSSDTSDTDENYCRLCLIWIDTSVSVAPTYRSPLGYSFICFEHSVPQYALCSIQLPYTALCVSYTSSSKTAFGSTPCFLIQMASRRTRLKYFEVFKKAGIRSECSLPLNSSNAAIRLDSLSSCIPDFSPFTYDGNHNGSGAYKSSMWMTPIGALTAGRKAEPNCALSSLKMRWSGRTSE